MTDLASKLPRLNPAQEIPPPLRACRMDVDRTDVELLYDGGLLRLTYQLDLEAPLIPVHGFIAAWMDGALSRVHYGLAAAADPPDLT